MPLRARAPAPALASAQMWGVRELCAVPARAARGASKPEAGRRTDLVASFPSGRLLTKRDVPSPRSGAVPARRPRTLLLWVSARVGWVPDLHERDQQTKRDRGLGGLEDRKSRRQEEKEPAGDGALGRGRQAEQVAGRGRYRRRRRCLRARARASVDDRL